MQILISPAKKMRTDQDFLPPKTVPVFLDRAELLARYLRALNYTALHTLLGCSEAIAQQSYKRYQAIDLCAPACAALLAYDGIQYQYMAPQVFEQHHLAYLERRLCILSGLYGLLRPFDGVVPYRLEMQARLPFPFFCKLYTFWGDAIYQELTRTDGVILNLASAEYSRCVRRYIQPGISFITCVFGELEDGRVREKGVYVKMARGEMVRFLAENAITDIREIRAFQGLGYRYAPERSDESTYVFVRESGSHGRRLIC